MFNPLSGAYRFSFTGLTWKGLSRWLTSVFTTPVILALK